MLIVELVPSFWVDSSMPPKWLQLLLVGTLRITALSSWVVAVLLLGKLTPDGKNGADS
jgi:hypothetical protein